jgi:sugar phosphate isomerase/epimerase
MNSAIILYTVRDAAAEDLPGTLKRVREIGFEYVQWSGMPDLPASEIRAHLDEAGLRAIAGHYPVESFEKDHARGVEHWKTIGAKDVAPGSMMESCRTSLEAWRGGMRRIEALGKKLQRDGIRLSYHNHAFEFDRFEGDPRYPLDILYAEVSPAYLRAELDTAWIHVGGEDPAAYLRKYAGRCPVVHAKDTRSERGDRNPCFTALGQGALDWEAIIRAATEADVEWLVYEQDTCSGDIFDSVADSYDFLQKNLG